MTRELEGLRKMLLLNRSQEIPVLNKHEETADIKLSEFTGLGSDSQSQSHIRWGVGRN